MTENKGNYAEVNGLRMYYEVHGEGEPLVLLHGGFGAIEMFGEILGLLAEGRKVIAVDLQAHGRTADIDRAMTFEAMADDVAALIRHVGFLEADVMGYSLGGGVALQTAIRHPEVVRKLVVVSTRYNKENTMSLPKVVSKEKWFAARKELLAREKELTRQRDALNAERRGLPMVRIEKDYVFEGPEGKANLLDLFEGRRQLIVGHFMFDPSWDEGCSSCSAGADEISDGLLEHLHTHDTTFVYVSRAPLAKIEAYKASKGWTFPWYSSYGSDFNYDFHVTLDESVVPAEYNYRTGIDGEQPSEAPGRSCFLREGGSIFHTYSVYARGLESVGGSYYFLDETVLGRQEDWEEPKGRAADARGAIPDFSS